MNLQKNMISIECLSSILIKITTAILNCFRIIQWHFTYQGPIDRFHYRQVHMAEVRFHHCEAYPQYMLRLVVIHHHLIRGSWSKSNMFKILTLNIWPCLKDLVIVTDDLIEKDHESEQILRLSFAMVKSYWSEISRV